MLLALAGPAGAAEADQGLALRQNMLTLHGAPLSSALGMAETRLRGWGTWELGPALLRAAVDTDLGFGTVAGASAGLLGGGTGNSRAFEWAKLELEDTGIVRLRARLDRLDLSWRWGDVDLSLGRQPVSLGTSHFVGVLDVLTPFAPGTLDATYKPGIDALRVRLPVGEAGEAEALVAGDPGQSGGALARVRTSVGGLDLELMGGRARQRAFGGLGWEGEALGAGIWGELAAFERRSEPRRGGLEAVALALVAGADWALPGEWKATTGVMYQDFGARSGAELALVSLDAPFQEGWTFLRGAGYGVLTLGRPLGNLSAFHLALLWNVVDGSTLWQPRLTTSIADNADLGLYGYLGLGARPDPLPRSEFGLIPVGGGLFARWFF